MSDSETKTLLKAILSKLEAMPTRDEFSSLSKRVDGLSVQIHEVLGEQKKISEKLDVATLTGRVEEQSRIVASLIPQTIAAVGR